MDPTTKALIHPSHFKYIPTNMRWNKATQHFSLKTRTESTETRTHSKANNDKGSQTGSKKRRRRRADNFLLADNRKLVEV